MFTILAIMSVAMVAFIGFSLKKIDSLEISYWKRALLQIAFLISLIVFAILLPETDEKNASSENSQQIEMTDINE